MKAVVFLTCLLGVTIAAPALESGSNEEIAAHAHTALKLMELYRLYGSLNQQGFGAAAVASGVVNAPAPPAVPNLSPPPHMPNGDSDEEGVPHYHGPNMAAPAAPLNSDEEEEDAAGAEAEEAEAAAAEGAEAEPAAADPAAVDPAAVDPAAVDLAAVDPAAVDPAAVDPAAVDPAAVDPAAADVAPDVDVLVAVPAGADNTAAVDAADPNVLAAATSVEPSLPQDNAMEAAPADPEAALL